MFRRDVRHTSGGERVGSSKEHLGVREVRAEPTRTARAFKGAS